MELSGLWSSYTGRDNLPPHCTESAKEGGEGTCPKPDGSGVEMELQPPHSVGGADSPTWARSSLPCCLHAQSCCHAGVGAIQHKLSRTVPAGTQRDSVPALTVVFIVYWCSSTKAFVTCWVPCNTPCYWVLCAGRAGLSSMSSTLSWQLLTAILHWAARQSYSRAVSSSNNVKKSVTLGKTPHLVTDQSILWPGMLKYLGCK